MRRPIRVLLAVVTATALFPATARAQSGGEDTFAKWGIRFGLGIDPDQFVFGGQASLGKWAITRFVPSVDVGLGDNLTTIDFNGDLFLRLAIPDASLEFYGGGGPTLAYLDPEGAGSRWEIGLSLVAGMRLPLRTQHAFNVEARFGLWDIPDFRLILGILF